MLEIFKPQPDVCPYCARNLLDTGYCCHAKRLEGELTEARRALREITAIKGTGNTVTKIRDIARNALDAHR